ncbi:MAG: phage holin family protein [Saprospiraceae bacterium]
MSQPLFLDYFIAQTTGNNFLIQIILNALALLLAASLLKGVEVKNFVSAIIVAIVLAVLNATLGALMDLVSAPLRWLTLGLFAFIVDAVVILVTAHYMKNFKVNGFISAVYLAFALSIFNLILSVFI